MKLSIFSINKYKKMSSQIVVEHYSEKAIVVRNTLEHHGPILTELGGTFNEKLRGGRGWIFSKFKVNQVKNIVEKLNSGQYGNEFDKAASSACAPITQGPSEAVEMVSKKEYLSVLTRVERLEALVSQLQKVMNLTPSTFEKTIEKTTSDKTSMMERVIEVKNECSESVPVHVPETKLANASLSVKELTTSVTDSVPLKSNKPIKKVVPKVKVVEEDINEEDDYIPVKRMVQIKK